MNIKAFIFDMDGVMLDNEPLQLRSYNAILKRFGHQLSVEEFKEKYMGLRDTQVCEKLITDFSLSMTPQEFVTEKRLSYLNFIRDEEVPPTPGLIQTVNALYAFLPLAVASSSPANEIEMITQKYGIRNKFQVIVSAHQVLNGKPAPDVYLKASELLAIPAEFCGAIEDTKIGIQSAKAAGMKCVAITTTHSASELQEADKVISSFEELVPVINKL